MVDFQRFGNELSKNFQPFKNKLFKPFKWSILNNLDMNFQINFQPFKNKLSTI